MRNHRVAVIGREHRLKVFVAQRLAQISAANFDADGRMKGGESD
jgi:hypothetical protein